jgi:hypothetical protein
MPTSLSRDVGHPAYVVGWVCGTFLGLNSILCAGDPANGSTCTKVLIDTFV